MAAVNAPSSVGNARDAGAVGQQSLDQRIQDTRNQIQQLRSRGSHGGPGSSGAGGDETLEALLKLLNKLLEQKRMKVHRAVKGLKTATLSKTVNLVRSLPLKSSRETIRGTPRYLSDCSSHKSSPRRWAVYGACSDQSTNKSALAVVTGDGIIWNPIAYSNHRKRSCLHRSRLRTWRYGLLQSTTCWT